MRPALCTEALRLGRVLAELMPAEPEVHGLVALMEIQASRLAARLSPAGLPIPLLEQNRGRWDQLLIRRGFSALLRAERLGSPPGPYVLQAAIAVCHAQAHTPGRYTDTSTCGELVSLRGKLFDRIVTTWRQHPAADGTSIDRASDVARGAVAC